MNASVRAATSVKTISGWKLSIFSLILLGMLAQMYIGLTMYLMYGEAVFLLVSGMGAAVSYVSYQNVRLSYFEWRVLELSIPLIGSLNAEYKASVPEATHSGATYVALLAITQYVKVRGMSEMDNVFKDFFPEVILTSAHRKLLGEVCDLAPVIHL
jgi:hypothetical protein